MCHQRSSEGRPSALVRRAKTLASVAVKVLVEENLVAPRRIALETGVGSVRGPPSIRVEEKETEKTAPEFISDLSQIGHPARSSRQLDRQVVAEKVVEVP